MLTPRLSVLSANEGLNVLGALLDGGWLDLYDGTQPASADTAPTKEEHVLASLQFSKPAFRAASNGEVQAYPLVSDPDARRTGSATWYRLYAADHKTVICDGSVGTKNANLVLNSVSIQEHAEVAVRAFSLELKG